MAGLERLLHSVVEDEDCQVNSLSIGGDLTSLHPDLLSEAVVRLERINLDRARLEGEQVKVMLTKVRDHPQLSLTTLSLDRLTAILFNSLLCTLSYSGRESLVSL